MTFSRRFFSVTLLLLAFTSLATAEPMNVLFIAIDDLKPLLGAYGYKEVQSPNIDRLASRGAVFLNAACQFPVCGPSRASLLTGLQPEETGILDLKTKMRAVHPDILTLPQHFKNNGYITAGVGKIFDGRCVDSHKEGDAPSWSWPYMESPPSPLPNVESRKATGCIDAPDDSFPDGRVLRQSLVELRALAGQSKPFFLAVGFKKPHLPFVAPKRYWDRYDPASIQLAAFQDKTEGNSGYGYWNSAEMRSYEGVPAQGRFDPALQRELIHGYMACVTWVDDLVGQLLREVDHLGLTSKTVIVLWGDNGWHLGDHGLWGKHTAFEEAVRVPLIIVDPRVGTAQIVASPVEFVDIFPTLCELTGLQCPAGLRGISLAANLKDGARALREASTAMYPSKGAFGYSLRTTRYRYIEWIDHRTAKVVGQDLFDFEKDPLGRRNLANDPAYKATVAELADLLHAQRGGWKLMERHLSAASAE